MCVCVCVVCVLLCFISVCVNVRGVQAHSLTHSLTHSLNHSLNHSLTHSFVQSRLASTWRAIHTPAHRNSHELMNSATIVRVSVPTCTEHNHMNAQTHPHSLTHTHTHTHIHTRTPPRTHRCSAPTARRRVRRRWRACGSRSCCAALARRAPSGGESKNNSIRSS